MKGLQGKNFHIATFGCQMNVRDSQWLKAALQAAGGIETDLENADVVLLNTCSVREKPERKVLTSLERLRGLGRKEAWAAVLGCVAQQSGPRLLEIQPVRLVAGPDGLGMVPEAIARLFEDPAARMSLLDFSPVFAEKPLVPENDAEPCAFVSIMQGCDNFCSYCIVPFTRGRQRSRAFHAIMDECRKGLARGAREITLLGQNVNAYGKDLSEREHDFGSLLHSVAALPGLERLRYVAAHPKDMDMDAIEAFRDLPNLAPRLHLPLQSGSNKILKSMRRRYDRDEYLRLVEALRAARPDIALSTDLIVGFPGEKEADFKDTLDLMRECGFMSSFSFAYSDRPGTRASLLPGKLERKTKLERLAALQSLQDELSEKWLQERTGSRTSILVEGPSARGESWQGRDPYGVTVNTPLPQSRDWRGAIINVSITGARRHSLAGELLD